MVVKFFRYEHKGTEAGESGYQIHDGPFGLNVRMNPIFDFADPLFL